MQGVIFGVHTDEVARDKRLRTRLDIDECFGTVINRFVAQAVAGIPLTLYGQGRQIRGYIALNDAMQCMSRLINCPPEPGQYGTVNQISAVYSVRHLAYKVARIGRKLFNLPVEIQRVENPRVEADEHPFEAIYEKLPGQFGFEAQVDIDEEIARMFELFLTDEVRLRIEQRKNSIVPRTWWSGVKRQVERLELLDLHSEIREDEQLYANYR
jgi:UDP-sulfoquinovose synthase